MLKECYIRLVEQQEEAKKCRLPETRHVSSSPKFLHNHEKAAAEMQAAFFGANAHGVKPPFEGAYRVEPQYDGGLNLSEEKSGDVEQKNENAQRWAI